MRHARLLAERADRLQRAVEVRAGFDMHGDDVGAGLGEGLEIGVARRDHQMHVERLLGVGPDRLHDVRPDRDVRHEVAVHDVDMDPVGAGGIDGADLLAELREIRGEDRRGDDQWAGHRCSPNMPVSREQRGPSRGGWRADKHAGESTTRRRNRPARTSARLAGFGPAGGRFRPAGGPADFRKILCFPMVPAWRYSCIAAVAKRVLRQRRECVAYQE